MGNVYKIFDTYTEEHSNRVSMYSVLIGKKLNLNEDEISCLKVGGLLHDIGKNEISDNILNKPSKLTDDEFVQMKTHITLGETLLQSDKDYEKVIPIVKYHHEKFNGNGYPYNLKGEEIPFLARITAIADTFDAMTSNRVYRNALPMETIIEEFRKNKGIQFDPQLVDVFLDILQNNPDEINQIRNSFHR
ncbi:Cyclic di-GMP phosphodiesterase response regulator RpfG [compost metagenome]